MKSELRQLLRNYVDRIVSSFRPQRVILFGSHAYGKPGKDSDIDLLVIKHTGMKSAERIRQAYTAIGEHTFPLDVIVLTPREIRQRRKQFDPFLEEILHKGKVVYERGR